MKRLTSVQQSVLALAFSLLFSSSLVPEVIARPSRTQGKGQEGAEKQAARIERIENAAAPISLTANEFSLKLNQRELMQVSNLAKTSSIIPGGERLTLHSKILGAAQQTFHPDWQRDEGPAIYAATPFNMLTFLERPVHLTYQRSPIREVGGGVIGSHADPARPVGWARAARVRRMIFSV